MLTGVSRRAAGRGFQLLLTGCRKKVRTMKIEQLESEASSAAASGGDGELKSLRMNCVIRGCNFFWIGYEVAELVKSGVPLSPCQCKCAAAPAPATAAYKDTIKQAGAGYGLRSLGSGWDRWEVVSIDVLKA